MFLRNISYHFWCGPDARLVFVVIQYIAYDLVLYMRVLIEDIRLELCYRLYVWTDELRGANPEF